MTQYSGNGWNSVEFAHRKLQGGQRRDGNDEVLGRKKRELNGKKMSIKAEMKKLCRTFYESQIHCYSELTAFQEIYCYR